MKFDDYACFRLSHDPNDPSINDIVDDRVRAMCDDWNLASCSGHRLKDELEDIARLRFLVAITTEYMGIMTSRGFNAPSLWQAFAKAVQRELAMYMSDLA